MKDLDAATLDDVVAYNKKYYVPNNAVLVVAGNLDIPQTKKWIEAYFGDIPKGATIARNYPKEEPIMQESRFRPMTPIFRFPRMLSLTAPQGSKKGMLMYSK